MFFGEINIFTIDINRILVNLSILKILYFPLKNLLNCFPIDPSEPTISKFNNYKIYI